MAASRPDTGPDADLDARAHAVRAFNRFYTRLLGLLDEHLLASRFSLTEVRVLYELAQRGRVDPALPGGSSPPGGRDGPTARSRGHPAAPTAAELGRALALDAAYLSRILRRFGAQGLVERRASVGDARAKRLQLTRLGQATFKPLNLASQRQVRQLLAALHPPQQAELVAAMQRIEALLARGEAGGSAAAAVAAEPRPPYLLRGLEIGDIGWIVRRQGQLYAQEYGWDATFEALVAKIAAGFVERFDPAWERAWVAEREGAIAGSVFCVRVNKAEAKLRLLYVEPSARGLGIGARLTDECIRFAREKGYRRLTLWTNAVLVAARRIYEARGFVLVKEERHHSFGHGLVGQHWRLDLVPPRGAPGAAPAQRSVGTTRTAGRRRRS